MPSFSQWQNLWQTLGVAPEEFPVKLYDDLIVRYREAHRHYHTLQHLDECLDKFSELKSFAKHPAAIELALWFHDVIYDPTRSDNERLSAAWAQASVLHVGLNETLAECVYDMVMATKHHVLPKNSDEEILIDCDLAILGAPPERFKEYDRQIRAEYAFVPDAEYKAKRREVLARFLARATLFNTNLFIARYEAQARANLTEALSLLP